VLQLRLPSDYANPSHVSSAGTSNTNLINDGNSPITSKSSSDEISTIIKKPLQGCSSERQTELSWSQWLEIYASTALRLRVSNIARVGVHRFCKQTGIYRWRLPCRKSAALHFPIECVANTENTVPSWADRAVLGEANNLIKGKVNYFSVHTHDVGTPPAWFLNPFLNKWHSNTRSHWSKIEHFSSEVGDIKAIWELSRFSWAPIFARASRLTGDIRYTSALRLWIEDWWRSNPPNTGPNWMCGQEVSIRLVNTVLALYLLEQANAAAVGFLNFIEMHCLRINATTSYATAQDNNHATSEAAGLFIGGTWLARHSEGALQRRGKRWAKKGRKLLEDSVRRLVLPDGSFSQHSLTYHRVLLDTLSLVEVWRRHTRQESFSADFYSRAAAATRWLRAMIDPLTGDGPNLGANDGAYPYRLGNDNYRDFRPCLQLASFVFNSPSALNAGPWDEAAMWLGVLGEVPSRPQPSSASNDFFPENGYAVMRSGSGAVALVRAPTARFRPSHADALHVDLWWKGTNILRDGGTYTYFGADSLANILSSITGHNTLQFDDHDQMPRISRFLYGAWVRVASSGLIDKSACGQSWSGSYTDRWGAKHKRTITLGERSLSVSDEVSGFKDKAVLRWRLAPENWIQKEDGCESSVGRIDVQSNVPILRNSITTGWESRHYLEKSLLPVLEVEIDQTPATLITTLVLT